MALQVAPTPVLKGKDVERFDKLVKEGLKKRTKLVPTPKLDEARRKIREYARKRGFTSC